MTRDAGGSPSPGPKRTLPKLLMVLGVVGLALIFLVAALPSILSTDFGRNYALDQVNSRIPGTIRIKGLSLAWLGGQSFEYLEIIDPEDRPVVTLESFSTELTLLQALRQKISLGETVIKGLRADLLFDDSGNHNLSNSLSEGVEGEGGGTLILPVTGNLALIEGRLNVTAPDVETVSFTDLSGSIQMESMDAPVAFSVAGRTRQNQLEGRFVINGRVHDLGLSGEDDINPRLDLDGSMTDLPIQGLDQLLDLQGVLSAAVGERGDLDVMVSGDANTQLVELDARAPLARINLKGTVSGNRFQLSEPAWAEMNMTPAFIDAVNQRASPDSILKLAEAVPLRLTIGLLDVPLDPPSPATAAVRAGLEADAPIQLLGVKELGEIAVHDLRMVVDSNAKDSSLKAQVDGRIVARDDSGDLKLRSEVFDLFDLEGNLSKDNMRLNSHITIAGLPTILLDNVATQEGLLVDALGAKVDLEVRANQSKGNPLTISTVLSSDNLETGPVGFTVAQEVQLSNPATITFKPSSALLGRFSGVDTALQTPVKPIELSITSAKASLDDPLGTSLELHADLKTEGLGVLLGDTRLDIEEPHLTLQITGADGGAASWGLETVISGDEETATIQANGEASAFMTEQGISLLSAQISMLASLEDAPTPLLAALSQQPLIPPLLGPTVNAALEVKTGQANDTHHIDIRVDSPRLKSQMAFDAADELVLVNPASIDFLLTPALLTTLSGDASASGNRLTIAEPARLKGTLNKLSWPLQGPLDPAQAGLSAAVSSNKIVLSGQTGADITLEDLTINVDATQLSEPLALTASARLPADTGEAGDLGLELVAGLAEGQLNTDDISLSLKSELNRLPVSLLDVLLNMEGLSVATLGSTADLRLGAELKGLRGPLSLTLSSDSTQANVDVELTEAGMHFLKDLSVEILPTPDFGRLVLSKVHPVFETTQRTDRPIRFTIPRDGVHIPLWDYELAGVVIPRMELDLGQTRLKSGWLLRGIVGIANQFGELESVNRDEWSAWFTPAVVSLEQGELRYLRRLDLLLEERIHLATWGSTDLVQDQADLTLAFMPDTLERLFNIQVNEGDALRIPITGAASAPSIDFKRASLDLGRLRAQKEVSKESELAGLLFGAATGSVTASGERVPSASMDPLPWAEVLAERDAERRARSTDETNTTAPEADSGKSTEQKVIENVIDLFGRKKTQ